MTAGSFLSGEPYPNIVICGDSEKLHPKQSSRKGSPLSTVDPPESKNQSFVFKKPSFAFSRKQGSTFTTTVRSPAAVSAIGNTADESSSNQDRLLLPERNSDGFSIQNFKPPPSAPSGQQGRRNRVKLYQSLNVRPYQIALDKSLNDKSLLD